MALTKIGIDAGGSLIKIAYRNNDEILYRKFEATDLENAVLWICNQFPDSEICITGGKGTLLQNMLKHKRCHKMVEFDATCRGIKHLLDCLGVNLDSFILTNVGTGTSIHFIDSDSNTRIGGTGVGGGSRTIFCKKWLWIIQDLKVQIMASALFRIDGLEFKC